MLDKIRQRIAALLAKTTSNGCTTEEAESAAAAAQKLMATHRIEVAELQGDHDAIAIEEQALWDGAMFRAWRALLANAVAKANGCKLWKDGPYKIMVAGTPDQIEVVRYLNTLLVRTIDSLTTLNGMGQGRRFANSYRLGLVEGIGVKLQSETRKANENAPTHAMVHIRREDEALVVYMDRCYPRMKRANIKSKIHNDAYNMGKRHGEDVTWRPGLSGKARTERRLMT